MAHALRRALRLERHSPVQTPPAPHPIVGGYLGDRPARVDHRSQQRCSQPGRATSPQRQLVGGRDEGPRWSRTTGRDDDGIRTETSGTPGWNRWVAVRGYPNTLVRKQRGPWQRSGQRSAAAFAASGSPAGRSDGRGRDTASSSAGEGLQPGGRSGNTHSSNIKTSQRNLRPAYQSSM
jgi:hypothetical protein